PERHRDHQRDRGAGERSVDEGQGAEAEEDRVPRGGPQEGPAEGGTRGRRRHPEHGPDHRGDREDRERKAERREAEDRVAGAPAPGGGHPALEHDGRGGERQGPARGRARTAGERTEAGPSPRARGQRLHAIRGSYPPTSMRASAWRSRSTTDFGSGA